MRTPQAFSSRHSQDIFDPLAPDTRHRLATIPSHRVFTPHASLKQPVQLGRCWVSGKHGYFTTS